MAKMANTTNFNKGFKPILFSTPMKRLMSKIIISETGCWNFTGYLNSKGYGKFSLNGKVLLAHTASFMIHGGIRADGYSIDHLCKNRKCVNPKHLELVLHKTNLERGNTLSSINKNKNYCNNGHEFNEVNTIFQKNNKRRCRICDLEWRKINYKNKKQKHEL